MDKLNRWLSLLANLGVIAGIIFVAIEVRQNSDMIRAQTRAQLAEEVTGLFTVNMNDSDYATILLKGNRGDELSEVERYQYDRHRNAWLHYWNNMAYQYRLGLYDEPEFTLQISTIRSNIDALPGLRIHWCKFRSDASDSLKRAIEAGDYGSFCQVNASSAR